MVKDFRNFKSPHHPQHGGQTVDSGIGSGCHKQKRKALIGYEWPSTQLGSLTEDGLGCSSACNLKVKLCRFLTHNDIRKIVSTGEGPVSEGEGSKPPALEGVLLPAPFIGDYWPVQVFQVSSFDSFVHDAGG
ncbi:unnamed protein product [Soboliphyme baturini]|uniref:Uncharacterized protein n=1 Tax=Soboliphyme baturini TaxID=241478 RepID=A0A183IGE0_9BILA|nr:unnamed protein product [Soboliphyme baturini]